MGVGAGSGFWDMALFKKAKRGISEPACDPRRRRPLNSPKKNGKDKMFLMSSPNGFCQFDPDLLDLFGQVGLVAHDFTLGHVDDVFGDIGGIIGNPLQVAGNPEVAENG